MNQFPQLRKDPIVDRWVLIAPERASRPGALIKNAEVAPDEEEDCPFCEGCEQCTPPELFALRDSECRPNTPGWRVRVVPNQFPAVRGELGTHELIVECPQHEASLAALPVTQIVDVLKVVRDRMSIRRREGWVYGQWFKNHGTAAGASLSHAHSQLVCMPAVPVVVGLEGASIMARRTLNDECIYCQLIERELADGEHTVHVTDQFVAFTALAGRFPYETWLLPRAHHQHFDSASDASLVALAGSLQLLLRKLDQVVGRPGYNLVLHNGPWNESDFHWHFELLPRITGIAGFEIGAGLFINPVTPEDAAARLRGH